MRTTFKLAAASMALGCAWFSPATFADSAQANCTLRKDGETKEGASGPCTFSQRQGYVEIDLRNGSSFSLSPGTEANHYKDQEGKKVLRTVTGDGAHEYKWEGKKIIVTFNGGHGQHNAAERHAVGEAPHALQDLPGGRYVGGEVDDQMTARGYKHIKDEKSGAELYSYWRSTGGPHCVVVRFDKNRHVASVVNASELDCK